MKKAILIIILLLGTSVIYFLYLGQNNTINNEVTNIEILPIEIKEVNDQCTDLVLKMDSNNSIPLSFDFKFVDDNRVWEGDNFYQFFYVEQLEVFNIVRCEKNCDLDTDYQDDSYIYLTEVGEHVILSQRFCKIEDVEIKGKLILKLDVQEQEPIEFSI